ncbi:MAG: hypothetical protein BGO06_26795 [Shinella sp. 65-6]|nr:MAG: hypothetical protein BGO06_26795 [Shinella sp. 65-6]
MPTNRRERNGVPGEGTLAVRMCRPLKEIDMAIIPNDPNPSPGPGPSPIPDLPPIDNPSPPVKEPDPDLLPDEEPNPNPDENDEPAKHARALR